MLLSTGKVDTIVGDSYGEAGVCGEVECFVGEYSEAWLYQDVGQDRAAEMCLLLLVRKALLDCMADS